MSFCRILSTLCSHVVFHNLPHFGKRAGQKVQRKIAVAVQNVKPLYFLSRSFALYPQKSAELFYMFLQSNCPRSPDGGFREGGIREGEIGDGEIVEGGC